MNRRSIAKFSCCTFLGIALAVSIYWIHSKLIEVNMIAPIFVILIALGSIFWLWVFFDCIVNDSSKKTNKTLWILIIIFTNGFGALGYFLIRRPQRIKELEK